jgi:hypothetical protein
MIALLEECWKARQEKPNPTLSDATAAIVDAGSPTSTILSDVSSEALLLRLHKRISQMIKSDVDQSVYLGILRYEPLVVEDLVDWLLERDVEVPEHIVRRWCDKEGICCIGRESLGGRLRARY